MNIGGRLLLRHGPRPGRGGGHGGGDGPGRLAASLAAVGGLAAIVAGTAFALEHEPFARWFVPACAVALAVAALVHGAASWRRGGEAGWPSLGIRSPDPMTIALCVLAAAVFVSWQLLAHRWGWPLALTARGRGRWRHGIGHP